MRFQFVMIPGEHETFAPDAFRNALNKPMQVFGIEGTLRAAHVNMDGSRANLTVEVPGDGVPIGVIDTHGSLIRASMAFAEAESADERLKWTVREYLAEKDSPAPDYTMRKILLDRLREQVSE